MINSGAKTNMRAEHQEAGDARAGEVGEVDPREGLAAFRNTVPRKKAAARNGVR